MKKKRGDWKAYECLCYHVGGGGNFSTGRNLPALKFFLSTDQPWSRREHTTHPRQTAGGLQSISQSTLAKWPKGYTTIHNSPSPKGQRATKFQTSKSTLEYRNSHLPVGVAWLPVSLGSSRPPPSDANFLYTGIPAQARSPLCVFPTGLPTTLTLA